jgi:hypothetical protein
MLSVLLRDGACTGTADPNLAGIWGPTDTSNPIVLRLSLSSSFQSRMDGWLINRSQVRCYLAALSKDGACTGTADPNSFEAGMGPDRHLEPNRTCRKPDVEELPSLFNL